MKGSANAWVIALVILAVGACGTGACVLGSCAGAFLKVSGDVAQEVTAEMKAREAAMSKPAIRVSPETLWRDYSENTVAADAKYLGKHVEVTGKVRRVSEMFNAFHVYLDVPDETFGQIEIEYPLAAREDVAKIKQGATYSFSGLCEGERVGIVSIKAY